MLNLNAVKGETMIILLLNIVTSQLVSLTWTSSLIQICFVKILLENWSRLYTATNFLLRARRCLWLLNLHYFYGLHDRMHGAQEGWKNAYSTWQQQARCLLCHPWSQIPKRPDKPWSQENCNRFLKSISFSKESLKRPARLLNFYRLNVASIIIVIVVDC